LGSSNRCEARNDGGGEKHRFHPVQV
jgi:hypothetical protein